jgi:hypothetical protein
LENVAQLDIAHLDPGRLLGNVYSNQFLGFSYQFPSDWHAGENRIGPAIPEKSGKSGHANTDVAKKDQGPVEQCTRVLSIATKHRQDDAEDTFNPRIMILAADPGCFAPDVKFPDSVHDKESIEIFGQALVQAFAGTALLGRDASRLIAADLSGHIFLEMPSGNAVPIPGSTLLRKVHMSFVLTSLQHYWVIWLMESDTESELGRLMRTSISFVPNDHSPAPESH